MNTDNFSFSNIVDAIYNLPLNDRLELKNLLEHNIAATRRNEIQQNYKATKIEEKNGNLKFSSSIKELKNML
jgi:hypothetical protein